MNNYEHQKELFKQMVLPHIRKVMDKVSAKHKEIIFFEWRGDDGITNAKMFTGSVNHHITLSKHEYMQHQKLRCEMIVMINSKHKETFKDGILNDIIDELKSTFKKEIEHSILTSPDIMEIHHIVWDMI